MIRHLMKSVAGYCPMGCGRTLFLGSGGYVTCSYVSCPKPDAVADLLDDHETEHIVEFGPETFTIRHPLRERLEDDLFNCELHSYLHWLDGPPAQPGRYRASWTGSNWAWQRLEKEGEEADE